MAENLVKQFPVVFNDNIYTMEGENFYIYFADDAVSFYVKTPRIIL